MEEVRIVEFHDGLAKAVAKMWNESRENWGGDAVVTTEQDVIDKEMNSSNLHLYIAMIGEEAVGYCGLSEYKEDTGALYIPLLNVHPGYHGRKIGKKLVLKALERTVELQWPRLDLFTWPGNTKAVPLYKKCGFFWEDRDDATHLMNFIPMVLQLEWLKPFFEKHDWYETSQRVIDVKPDGIKEHNHTFYEYQWEAGSEFVRIQIERTGRGIRLIETEEILIETSVPDFKLLEKEEHLVTYRVVNKTNQPWEVKLKGLSSDIVSHSFEEIVKVEDEWTGQFPVVLNTPLTEPSPWKTHPCVGAHLTVNGCVFPLKMGIYPRKAGKLELRSLHNNWRIGKQDTLYLDLVSNLEVKSNWIINLPENELVDWEVAERTIEINGEGRVSLPVPVRLKKHGFLSETIEVKALLPNGETITFDARLALAFPGYGSKFGGETEEYWYGYHGPFYVQIEKRNHLVKIGSIRSNGEPMTLFTPKLGKPFSEEFSKKDVQNVEFLEQSDAFLLKTSLDSEAFSPLTLNTYFKLYGDGLVEISYGLKNKGQDEKRDFVLKLPFPMECKGMAIPQNGGVMIGEEVTIPFMDYIQDKNISEPWMFFTSTSGHTLGLAWPKDAAGKKDDWRFSVEYSFDSIPPESEVQVDPVQIGVNAVPNWLEWRELTMGPSEGDLKEVSMYELEPANGEIVARAGGKVDFVFRSMLNSYIHGDLSVTHGDETLTKKVRQHEETTKIDLVLDQPSPGIQVVDGRLHSKGLKADMKALQLIAGEREVEILQDEGVWSVDNGVLTFRAAESYFPGIYSLTYNRKEFFDHQFPNPGPKAWWNPWGGGLRYSFPKVNPYSVLKEQTKVEPVTKTDQNGHPWTGLCLTTVFTKHEKMKGVTLRQYALTLPEVPILATFAVVEQNSGRTFANEILELEAFFKPGEDLTSCFAKFPTEGKLHTFYAGVEEQSLRDTPFMTVGSDEHEDQLTLIHPFGKKGAEVYMNQEVFLAVSEQEWAGANRETVAVEPSFLLLGDSRQYFEKVYRQLYKISF